MAKTLIRKREKTAPSHQPRTVRNVASNWGGYTFNVLITFFLSPYVVHRLGSSAYGVWILMVSLTGYLGLLDFGVRGAVTRYIAKFHEELEHEKASRIASSALVIFAAAGILAILSSLVLAKFFGHWFHVPEDYRESGRIVILLAGVSVAVSLVGGVFGGIMAALQRFELLNAVEIVGTGLRALMIFFSLRAGRGLVALSIIQLSLSLATVTANAWIGLRLYPTLRIRLGKCERQYLNLIFSFSIYSFFLHVSTYVIFYTDSLVIGAFLSVSFITFFAIAGNLISYTRALVSGVTQTISPLASRLEAQGNPRELQRVTHEYAGYVTMLILPIAVTFLLRGKSFIGLWMGPEFGDLSGRVLQILTLALIFIPGNGVAWAVMFGISKHKVPLPVSVGEGLCNLALSCALARPMGIIGVAWATTLPSLASNLLFWPWYVRRTLGIPIRDYVFSTWGLPVFAALPFAFSTYLVERLWLTGSLFLFFTQVGLVLPVALVGFWYSCISRSQRRQYVQSYVQPIVRALVG